MTPLWAVATIVAEAEQQDPDQLRSVIDKAGPIAGLFVLVLGIALFLLFRSMNRQMKKIDPNLPEGPDDALQREDQQWTREAVERGDEAPPSPPSPPSSPAG